MIRCSMQHQCERLGVIVVQVLHISAPEGLLALGRRRMLLDYLHPILQVRIQHVSWLQLSMLTACTRLVLPPPAWLPMERDRPSTTVDL